MESSEFEAAVIEYDAVTRQLGTATGLELEKLVIIRRDLEAFINRRQNPLQSTVQAIGIVLPDGRAIEHTSTRVGSSSYESWSEVHHKNLVVKEGYKNINDFIRAGGVRYTRTTYFIWLEMTSQPAAVKNALNLAYQLASVRPQAVFVLDLWSSPEGVTKSYRFESLIELEKFLNRRQNPMSPHSQWWGWYDPGKNKFIYPRPEETIHTDIALRLFPKKKDRDDAFEAASRRGMVRFALDLTVDGVTPSASDKYGVPYLLVEARDIRHNADAIDRVLEEAHKHSKLFNQIVVADGRGMIQNSKTIDEARKKLWEAHNPKAPARSTWDVGRAQYEAYKAGVRAGDTGLFEDWVIKSGQAHRSPTLLARLQHEFNRGVMGEPWYTTQYKGATIERLSTGDYRVSLDPESRLESFREAVRLVDYWAKHQQRNPRPDKYLSGSTRGIVLPGGKIIEQPYVRGETHEKMIRQAGYEDSLDFFLKGGVRYIRRDNGMEIELGADPRAIRHALKVAWTFPREEYFVDLWRSADVMDYVGAHSYRELERFLKKEAA